MEKWYKFDNIEKKTFGKREKYDNNIFTFDIETTSFITIDNVVYPAVHYDDFTKEEQERLQKEKRIKYYGCMYIWQFGVNDKVYYGRTWEELADFLLVLNTFIPEKKIVFVHNLAFEFQFLKGDFSFKSVMARKKRKVMTAIMREFNILFKCSYFMSNASLKDLPKLFKLPVEKMVGDLDYNVLRNSKTELTEKELRYCEYDCLVVYYFILEELKTYENVKNIPTTSTGHVRRELQDLTSTDFKYKRLVSKAINTDPVVFNRLQDSFAGGITHANWLFSGIIHNNVDSWDETSAYPYALVCYKYPSSEFREVELRDVNDMSRGFCYILEVEFQNVNSRFYNTYISSSKCRDIRNAVYDNGRIISADSFSMTITDIDFYLILDCYECDYKITRAWFSTLAYLPLKFINFILDKYVKKTEYKGVEEMELEYTKEKNKFNALYGMSVTNNIRDKVIFDDESSLWDEVALTNDEIISALNKEKSKAFLSFSYGIFCTAYARDILWRRVMELDEYVLYVDTDSIKLREGYNRKIIEDYNKEVKKRIEYVSKVLRIDKSKFAPCDKDGAERMLGLFELEGNGLNPTTYTRFVTQGAKKYCFERLEKDKETKEIKNKISITVSGVPKKGAKVLTCLDDFKDNLYFPYSVTNKQSVVYNDVQEPIELTDYQGNTVLITDKSACCLLPSSYTLGRSEDYQHLLINNSSKRAKYRE